MEIERDNDHGLPRLRIFDNAHTPYTKTPGTQSHLYAEFKACPNPNGRWLQIYFHETTKGRTRVIGVCLSGESLAQLRALIATIPE